MLTVEQVTKCYGDFTALEDLSLDFTQGVYGLLAPNGAGKSTLMKLLATLLFPTRGKILWDGEEIVSMGEAYRGLLGYLPQDFGYYPNYTPRQFMRYAAALQKLPRAETDKRIMRLLELVGLSDAVDKKLKKLSGGMCQRVGIAVAMLILDEPTAGLDPGERVRFRSLIHSLSEDRIVILSTHIVSDIETIAGHIVMLRDHRLLCCDTPAQICRRFRGKIFQIPADAPRRPHQHVLSEGQGENGTVLRILSEMPPENGIAVAPSLEDAFLAIYAAERNDGVL